MEILSTIFTVFGALALLAVIVVLATLPLLILLFNHRLSKNDNDDDEYADNQDDNVQQDGE